jgi:hypothetical protein
MDRGNRLKTLIVAGLLAFISTLGLSAQREHLHFKVTAGDNDKMNSTPHCSTTAGAYSNLIEPRYLAS